MQKMMEIVRAVYKIFPKVVTDGCTDRLTDREADNNIHSITMGAQKQAQLRYTTPFNTIQWEI